VTVTDPFAAPSELYVDSRGIMRDAQDRPLIVPPGGSEPVAYRRASSVPKVVDNLAGLMRWRLRILTWAMATYPDLAARAARLEPGDPELLVIADEAHERAGGNAKAQWGTDVHVYTEPEADLRGMPDEMAYDVAAYRAALAAEGVEVLGTEVFVVNDELGVAGTLDHLYRVAQLGVVIGDKKTGDFHAMSCAIQLAIYAGAEQYLPDPLDPTRGTRVPLWNEPVNQEWGVVARIPRLGGSCTLTTVDIRAGLVMARKALERLPYQEQPGSAWVGQDLVKVTRRQCLAILIQQAETIDAIGRIKASNERYWTKALSEAANARWRELRSLERAAA
jgi:hypothetical protein